MSVSLSEVGLTKNLGDKDEEVVNTGKKKKRWGGGNQIQQMYAGRKEDRLAAEQKRWEGSHFHKQAMSTVADYVCILGGFQNETGNAHFLIKMSFKVDILTKKTNKQTWTQSSVIF